jgi:hypothetical protein
VEGVTSKFRIASLVCAGVAFVAAIGVGETRAALIKNLEFNVDGVLPSDDLDIELFNFSNPVVPEETIYEVSGGFLKQTSFSHIGNFSYTFPNMFIVGGGVDPSQSFSIEARLKIVAIEGFQSPFLSVFDGINDYTISFSNQLNTFNDGSGELEIFFEPEQDPAERLTVFDTDNFHTYRLESPGNSGSFSFFIDDMFKFSGTASLDAVHNGFEWGDGFSQPDNGSDVYWDFVRFRQPALQSIPEPTTLSLLGLGLAGAGFVLWRRQKRSLAQRN